MRALAEQLRAFDPERGKTFDLWCIGRNLRYLSKLIDSRRALEEGAREGRRTAERQMIAAAAAREPTVDEVLLGVQAGVQRRVEHRQVDASRLERDGVEGCDQPLDPAGQLLRERFARAEPIDRVVANVERDGAMAGKRHAVAEPAIARAQIEHGERSRHGVRHRFEHVPDEGGERACADRPLSGKRTRLQERQREQLVLREVASFGGAVFGVGGSELG